jgi:hypothetical protein
MRAQTLLEKQPSACGAERAECSWRRGTPRSSSAPGGGDQRRQGGSPDRPLASPRQDAHGRGRSCAPRPHPASGPHSASTSVGPRPSRNAVGSAVLPRRAGVCQRRRPSRRVRNGHRIRAERYLRGCDHPGRGRNRFPEAVTCGRLHARQSREQAHHRGAPARRRKWGRRSPGSLCRGASNGSPALGCQSSRGA